MSRYPSLQIHPGRGLGFLILGASLHDVLTRLKAQPHLYPTIHVSYSPAQPLLAPVVLDLPANGFRLRFDGPDQRLRLIEILDFGKTQLSYKNIDLVKLPEATAAVSAKPGYPGQHGPAFRHVYNRLMGPTFPGEYFPPQDATGSHTGLYILSYPGLAFTFPLQHTAWSSTADFVSLLSSNAAASAKSLAIFIGNSWHEARQTLFVQPCLNPRSLALSMKGKEHQPDEVDLVNVCGGGVVELVRRSSTPFRVILGETTPQDLVAELGPPDAIYRKNDHRLSIHRTRRRKQRASHGSYGASPARSDDLFDTDQSSAHTTTDDSDVEDHIDPREDDHEHPAAKCFYNYFHHGFDVFISYPSNSSPPFPHSRSSAHPPTPPKAMGHLVATKILLHGNVPGSYPFNRYRRSRWVIDAETSGSIDGLDSETSFSTLSKELRNVWKGNYASEQAEKAMQNAIVLDRDWGDSPGSSYEVLEGWEDGEPAQKKGSAAQQGSGSGTTQIFGFPGMLFEVLKNDTGLVQRSEPPGIMWILESPPPRPQQDEPPACAQQSMPSPASKLLPKNWKSTLCLPRTSFPARNERTDRDKYLGRCTKDLYRWQRETRTTEHDGDFVLHDGPPFANGPLHIGHALNKILKDITCRFQLSLGKRVDFVPGWDCHGLPIEIKALEQQPARVPAGSSVLREPGEIRRIASRLAHDAFTKQRDDFQQWGIMADWDKPWKTMDQDYELRQLEIFKSMVKKGLIHRRRKPVYWSPSSRTALAEAELEYRDNHNSTAAYVKFPMDLDVRHCRGSQLWSYPQTGSGCVRVNALIWTTTPWTLPANRAIAVRSDIMYYIVNNPTHGRLLIASTAVKEVEKVLRDGFEVIDNIMGEHLVGQKYWDPIYGAETQQRPMLNAWFVSSDIGTGLVHMAPGHGMDDYETCQQHGISAYAPVDDAGCFVANALPPWAKDLGSRPVLFEGNAWVVKVLGSCGSLVKAYDYCHKYPYDWRTDQPVIVRATEQWFADVGQIQETALKSLETVNFLPASGRARLRSFVNSRAEWCISRQRTWGVPIPALYFKDSGKAIMTSESIEHIIKVVAERGTNAWFTDVENDPGWIAPSLLDQFGTHKIRRGQDTMDVWFDSGTSWTTMLKDGDKQICAPADVYLEGTDQHRGWFQSSLLTYVAQQSIRATDQVASSSAALAPFKSLITHGFVLDGEGRKMSKSIGNVISPEQIIEGTLLPRNAFSGGYDVLGPDALRLWVASTDYTSDVKVNLNFLQSIQTTLKKYRITFRFTLGALQDFRGPLTYVSNKLAVQNRMAILKLQQVHDSVRVHYSNGEYNRAVADINRYIAQDVSAFYMEAVKDALYTDRGEARWQAQLTLLMIHQGLQTMLAPVTPLLIEEIWEHTSDYMKEAFTHPLQTQWPMQKARLDLFKDAQLAKDLPLLDEARKAINTAQERARSAKCMGSSLECHVMLQFEKVGPGIRNASQCFQRYLPDLATIFVVSQVDMYVGAMPSCIWTTEWIYSEAFEADGIGAVAHICKPSQAKCVRCWRFLAPVEARPEEAVCERCEGVLDWLRQSDPGLFRES
ncbi:MAG: hypothetical protein Q9177_003268 [Variospora cf. flavescens]